jgi:lactoylglutathione lyase
MIKFSYTILYVEDVSKAVNFYKNAFGFDIKFITPETDYAELISGETTLSFASNALASTNLSNGFIKADLQNKPFAIEIGFVVNNVTDVVANALKFGATIVEQPKQKPWGQTVAYLRDLDGFLIEICTEMS